MKVLGAGASGALGAPLTRRLVAGGHEVLGLTHDRANVAWLEAMGATAIVADALDRDALLRAVDGVTADAVIHELSALKRPPMRHRGMAMTDRLRTEGTTNLVHAASAIGATRFVAQSFVLGYGYRHREVLVETAPFGQVTGDRNDPHVAAMLANEEQAFATPHGVALRYGLLYGGDVAAMRSLLAQRGVPVVAGGTIGWVHHDDAVEATVAALERGRAGQAYNVVDDQPATWQEVFTAMARALGARPPHRLPRWVFRVRRPCTRPRSRSTRRWWSPTPRPSGSWAGRPHIPSYREGVAAMAGVAARGRLLSTALAPPRPDRPPGSVIHGPDGRPGEGVLERSSDLETGGGRARRRRRVAR